MMDNAAENTSGANRCIFLLLESFSSIGLSSAIGVLSAANHHADDNLYEWIVCTDDGAALQSGDGIVVNPSSDLPNVYYKDTILFVEEIGIRLMLRLPC